jgi:hypothetical protein
MWLMLSVLYIFKNCGFSVPYIHYSYTRYLLMRDSNKSAWFEDKHRLKCIKFLKDVPTFQSKA